MGVLDLVEAYDTIASIVMEGQSLGPLVGPEKVQYSAIGNVEHVHLKISGIKRDREQNPTAALLESVHKGTSFEVKLLHSTNIAF